jgi:hypothetical protein
MSTGFEWSDNNGQKHDASFHFDKGILALFGGIFTTLLVQCGVLVWWASGVSANLTDQARRIAIVEIWHETQTTQGTAIARLEERIGTIATRLDRIEARLFHAGQ